jgi:hypothetical protein
MSKLQSVESWALAESRKLAQSGSGKPEGKRGPGDLEGE